MTPQQPWKKQGANTDKAYALGDKTKLSLKTFAYGKGFSFYHRNKYTRKKE